MTILGVDYGKRRIGIAKSDELNMFAHGVGYVRNESEAAVMSALQEYITAYGVDRIVVGLPRRLNGELGQAAEEILQFVDRLTETLGVVVVTWDERLTTKEADRFFLESGTKGKKKRERVDQLACQIMLQSYLDSIRSSGEREQ